MNGIPPRGGNLGLTDVSEGCLVLPFDTAGKGQKAIALRRVTFKALAVKKELPGFLAFTFLDQDAGIDAVFFGRSRLDKQRKGSFCVGFCDQEQCGGTSVGRGMIESRLGAEGRGADDILVSQR
ncbi:hypothetical protein HFN89_41220 [Rhizobium laguerreae]|nr:hypothetical protein [Rhizobium laguerreae]